MVIAIPVPAALGASAPRSAPGERRWSVSPCSQEWAPCTRHRAALMARGASSMQTTGHPAEGSLNQGWRTELWRQVGPSRDRPRPGPSAWTVSCSIPRWARTGTPATLACHPPVQAPSLLRFTRSTMASRASDSVSGGTITPPSIHRRSASRPYRRRRVGTPGRANIASLGAGGRRARPRRAASRSPSWLRGAGARRAPPRPRPELAPDAPCRRWLPVPIRRHVHSPTTRTVRTNRPARRRTLHGWQCQSIRRRVNRMTSSSSERRASQSHAQRNEFFDRRATGLPGLTPERRLPTFRAVV